MNVHEMKINSIARCYTECRKMGLSDVEAELQDAIDYIVGVYELSVD